MRIAIISDIHGNLEGLNFALQDIEQYKVDRIICLGDMVDGGYYNEEVVSEMIKRNITCIKGNHDEINDLHLKKDIQNYLINLPEEIIDKDNIYTHISPRVKKRKIDNEIEAWNVFEETKYKLIFVGHVHYPVIFGKQCEDLCSSTKYMFYYNEPFELDNSDRYIICVGAVGYGRDLIGKIRYGIYDDMSNTIEIRAIEGMLLSIDWKYKYQQI